MDAGGLESASAPRCTLVSSVLSKLPKCMISGETQLLCIAL